MDMVAGGISKRGVRWRSMVRACWMVKVPLCDAAVASRMPADQMGSSRTMDLSSSTRCTVDSRHRSGSPEPAMSPGVTIAARSKNLNELARHGTQPAIGGDERVELLVLVQHAGVLRHGGAALPERGGDHLRQPRERAAPRLQPDVERVPCHEHHDGDEHGDGRDPEPPPPPHVLLDVHHHRQGEQHREPHREEVEVEVAPLPPRRRRRRATATLLPLLLLLAVELVGAERHHAGADAAGAEGRAEQGEVEHGELPPGGAAARRGAVRRRARRGAERREQRGRDEGEHAELVEDGSGDDGPEAAGEGVGGERAQDRGEAGRAVEVGQRVGRLHQRQVQLLRQVRDQVRAEPRRGEPVADLVR
ncbi:Os05g0410601, partial [Oryza sativa Japonica Group]